LFISCYNRDKQKVVSISNLIFIM